MSLRSHSSKPDLANRADIELLVNTFYDRVNGDAILGFIFSEVAAVDWDHHLPKMYAFWETVLFRSGGYKGNPLAVHAALVGKTPMGRAQFDQWLLLFHQTVDQLFAGEKADHVKRAAEDMAHVIYSKINGVPDPRFDPASLTPEQRERYRQYREAGAPSDL